MLDGYRSARSIMTGAISPDVARVALALRRSHPQVPALDVLDICLRQRTGRVDDFGTDACNPDQPFGGLIVEAFNTVMTPVEWTGLLSTARADAQKHGALLDVWRTHVLSRFVNRYGLTHQ